MTVQPLCRLEDQAFITFTHRFAALIDAGVRLNNCLVVLQQEPIAPYDEAANAICLAVLEGAMLSDAMKTLPRLFPPTYVSLVYAGEVGGILESTLLYAAELLELNWKYARVTHTSDGCAALLFPGEAPLPDDLAQLAAEQRDTLLMLFCRTHHLLLSAGVPLKFTMEVAGEFLPARQRELWQATIEKAGEGDSQLADAPFLSPTIQRLILMGEREGTLEQAMLKAADIYLHDLKMHLWSKDGQIR